MNRPPRVSIIVATYKGRWLETCLRSIEAQTFASFEVLVMDDANEPHVEYLVDSLGDERFLYHGNAENLGVAANHARGFSMARGDLVAVLNHDDYWESRTLQELVEEFDRQGDVSAVFSSARVADPTGEFNPDATLLCRERWGLASLREGRFDDWFTEGNGRLGFPIGPATVMRLAEVRRVAIPKIVGGSYDYWLGYRIARDGSVVHIDRGFGYWREHGENLTNHRSFRQSLELLYVVAVACTDRRLPGKLRLAQAANLPRRIAASLRQGFRDATQTSRSKRS